MLSDVSLYLLKAPHLNIRERSFKDYILNTELLDTGRNIWSPELVKNTSKIVHFGRNAGCKAEYKCTPDAVFSPAECLQFSQNITSPNITTRDDVTSLVFRFVYDPDTEAGPYGEIKFNFAQIYKNLNGIQSCHASHTDFRFGWQLYYFRSIYKTEAGHRDVIIASSWTGTCTTPSPYYDKTLNVCEEDLPDCRTFRGR